jgi:hypothetical protein
MFGLKRKLGIKVMVILLFSIFILAGLNMTQAYGQPLDSPIYSHTKTEAVESMNTPAGTTSAVHANGPVLATCIMGSIHSDDCHPLVSVPVMLPAGEFVFILTLTGGACWAILKKK